MKKTNQILLLVLLITATALLTCEAVAARYAWEHGKEQFFLPCLFAYGAGLITALIGIPVSLITLAWTRGENRRGIAADLTCFTSLAFLMLLLAWPAAKYNILIWQHPKQVLMQLVDIRFGDPCADRIWLEKPLAVPFQTNGYTLYRGTKGCEIGLPPEAFLKLVAVKTELDGEKYKIVLPKTTSLKGYAAIKTPEDALALARLFTDLNTHYLFEDSEWLEIAHSTEKGKLSWAWLPTVEFTRLGLFAPKVKKENNRFVIERCLLNSRHEIVRSKETIAKDGGYVIQIEAVMAVRNDVIYPFYE